MTAQFLDLYRLQGDGRVRLQCRLRVLPDETAVLNFRKQPGLASFLRMLSTIGNGGPDCGTMHSGLIHDGAAQAAFDRVGFRPWAVSRAAGPYYRYDDDRLNRFIEDWSFDEIWNRREYQTFLQHYEPAKTAIERYIGREFGLPPSRAKEETERVFQELLAAWFLIPQDYQRDVRERGITEALLKYDVEALRAAMSAWRTKTELSTIGDFLHDAIEWPHGLEILLEAGAETNRGSGRGMGFGKTPLMTAAHMNRPDTVKILLKRGADPNARTNAPTTQCGFRMERGNRTALMYAAENAGPEVIALLLESGADPSAEDSKGNGLHFYLALNPRFRDNEKRMNIQSLVNTKRSQSKGPSFNCGKVSSRIEREICADDILSMLDAEMGEAFNRWRRVGGEHARRDQLNWLGQRNHSCPVGNKDVEIGCLQQLTRARVRYLHNRLAELSPN